MTSNGSSADFATPEVFERIFQTLGGVVEVRNPGPMFGYVRQLAPAGTSDSTTFPLERHPTLGHLQQPETELVIAQRVLAAKIDRGAGCSVHEEQFWRRGNLRSDLAARQCQPMFARPRFHHAYSRARLDLDEPDFADFQRCSRLGIGFNPFAGSMPNAPIADSEESQAPRLPRRPTATSIESKGAFGTDARRALLRSTSISRPKP